MMPFFASGGWFCSLLIMSFAVVAATVPKSLYFETHHSADCSATIEVVHGVVVGKCQTDSYFMTLWGVVDDNTTHSFYVDYRDNSLFFDRFSSENCSSESLFASAAVPVSPVNVSLASVDNVWQVNACSPHPLVSDRSIALRVSGRYAIPPVFYGYFHTESSILDPVSESCLGPNNYTQFPAHLCVSFDGRTSEIVTCAASQSIIDKFNTSNNCTGPSTSLYYPPYCGENAEPVGYPYYYNVSLDTYVPIGLSDDDSSQYYYSYSVPDVLHYSSCQYRSRVNTWPRNPVTTTPTMSPTGLRAPLHNILFTFSLFGVKDASAVNDSDVQWSIANAACTALNLLPSYCVCDDHCLQIQPPVIPIASNTSVVAHSFPQLRSLLSPRRLSLPEMTLQAVVNVSLNPADFGAANISTAVLAEVSQALRNISATSSWISLMNYFSVSHSNLFFANVSIISSSILISGAGVVQSVVVLEPTAAPTTAPVLESTKSSSLSLGEKLGLGISLGAIGVFQLCVIYFCFCYDAKMHLCSRVRSSSVQPAV